MAKAIERTPPHDIDAEKALLGACLLEPKIIDDANEKIGSDDMFRAAHQVIFKTLLDMRQEGAGIDALSVRDRMSQAGTLNSLGSPTYLLELVDSCLTTANAERYVDIVRRKSIMRELTKIGADIQAIGYDDGDVDEAFSYVQSVVMGLVLSNQHDSVPVGTVLSDLWRTINEGGQPYITPYGVPSARMMAGDMMVIGAGTSAGKTAITLHWCDEWAKKHKVAYFEYEMSEESLMARLVCKHAGVTMAQVQDCDFNPEELDRVRDAMNELRSRKLDVEEVWCDVGVLMAKIRKAAMMGTEIVVIDHLGLIPFKRSSGQSEAKAIGVNVTNPLKRLASELGIRIVLLVQINRSGSSDADKFPKLFHLRDSGEIEQDASIALMLWSDKGLLDDENTRAKIREKADIFSETELWDDSFNAVHIGIEKNRNGPLGQVWAKFIGEKFDYVFYDKDGNTTADRSLF